MPDFRKNPEQLAPILGRDFVRKLTEQPALVIGRDSWSRHEIATSLGITQTVACGILSAICKRLGVRSTQDLYNRTSYRTFADAEHRAGVTTMFVLFAAFRAKGLQPEPWYRMSFDRDAMVSFLTAKHRELTAERRTKADAPRMRTEAAQAAAEAHAKKAKHVHPFTSRKTA